MARRVSVRLHDTRVLVDEPVAERYGELLALARSQKHAAKATDRDARQAELARAADIP